MMRTMLKSKISYAKISDLQLHYKGSVTIDAAILEAANLREGERVDVLNLNNGVRLETYVIKGEKGSGMICLNGPAARLAYKGDKIVILSYGIYTEPELDEYKAVFVELNEENAVKNTYLA